MGMWRTLIVQSPDKWWVNDFPGGKVEHNEFFFWAAWRELCEELGGKILHGLLAKIAIVKREDKQYGIYVFFAGGFEGIKSSPEGKVYEVSLDALIRGYITLSPDSKLALNLFLQKIGGKYNMSQPGGDHQLAQQLTTT